MKNNPIQPHHLIYGIDKYKNDELKVPVYRSEHYYITCLNRFKKLSKGALLSLEWIILKHKTKHYGDEYESRNQTSKKI